MKDDPQTIARTFQTLLQDAKNDLIGRKGIRLAHLYAYTADGSLTLYALDLGLFDPNGPKQRTADNLRARLIREGTTHYGFYTEVWLSRDPAYKLPEQDPNRDEALQLIVGTRQRGYSRAYRMVKRPDGTVRRLTEMDYDPNADGGRFGHLLTDRKWTPADLNRPDTDHITVNPDAGASLRH